MTTRTTTMIAAVLVALAAGAGGALAQDAGLPMFEPIRPPAEPLPACPADLQAAVKDCTIAATFTKQGTYDLCYCDTYGVTARDTLPIPPDKRNLARASAADILKITEAGTANPDPCEVITINGQRKLVCW